MLLANCFLTPETLILQLIKLLDFTIQCSAKM